MLFRIRIYFTKLRSRDQKNRLNEFVEYNPQSIEHILKKFNELNQYITDLENSLKAVKNKNIAYEDMLQKYEKIFKEEIALYRLHKSNISVINQTFNENELFLHEIQQHIQSFIESTNTKNDEKQTSFKRILSRFFHQNELHKSRVKQKLNELNETIEQKNRLVERMHNEIETWCNQIDSSVLPAPQLPMKQAYGY